MLQCELNRFLPITRLRHYNDIRDCAQEARECVTDSFIVVCDEHCDCHEDR